MTLGGEQEMPTPQAPIEVLKKPSNDGENIIKKAIEKITETGEGAKKGGKGFGCFWAFSILEFLFCFDTESEETSPFLFHFSWKNGARRKVEERLKMVDVMPTSRTVQFKNGGSEDISLQSRTHFSWVWKFQPEAFMPSKHCKIINVGQQGDYKLICDTSQRTHTNPVWTKNVSQSQVVKPTISLQPKS